MIGGIFPVSPGSERRLLHVLDEGDPESIASWVGALHRPPVLQTREGEPLVECETVVDLGDPVAARAFLDATYRQEDAGGEEWLEMFPLHDDEEIVRGRFRLSGARLVVSTTSEARADRVLATIETELPEAKVVSDERIPMDVNSMRRRAELKRQLFPDRDDRESALDDAAMAEVRVTLRNRFEERWCDQSIPALDGYTPREAADDPTRLGDLERLIASFEGASQPGSVTMRPERLRELLGL